MQPHSIFCLLFKFKEIKTDGKVAETTTVQHVKIGLNKRINVIVLKLTFVYEKSII